MKLLIRKCGTEYYRLIQTLLVKDFHIQGTLDG
jgi:hypothetical protein